MDISSVTAPPELCTLRCANQRISEHVLGYKFATQSPLADPACQRNRPVLLPCTSLSCLEPIFSQQSTIIDAIFSDVSKSLDSLATMAAPNKPTAKDGRMD